MPANVASGLFQPRPREHVLRDLVERTRRRLEGLNDEALTDLLQDALYTERRRLERAEPKPGEKELLEGLARALVRGDRVAKVDAALGVARAWADEIHGRFSQRAYRFATRILPGAITGLLSRRPRGLRRPDLSPDRRLKVEGNTALLRELAEEATLVLVPTHVSNLDSPVIGLALHLAGLPPFVYGAGLNLFSNPVMGFFMARLGAYTVDRTKKAELYKEILKDYSVRCLTTRHHSLFFPGGTRARSGKIETHLKKGLMGTGIVAWQEMLESGRKDPDVYFVPMTLSCQLVLEANTLISDHLEEVGKQRYIIADDESADARQIAQFANRILDLDAFVVARFGDPIDVLGNPVPADAIARAEAARARRGYVCAKDGTVEWDAQRDHIYTERLATAITAAYPKLSQVFANHLAAWVAWRMLEDAVGTKDTFRLVRAGSLLRRFPKEAFLARLAKALRAAREGAERGAWFCDLPDDPAAVLAEAFDRFSRYHRTRALADGGDVVVMEDAKLSLYYRNRLAHAELEG